MNSHETLLSGIAPSGRLTLGNYLGAIKNWADLQHDYLCLFPLVDLHAITVRQNPRTFDDRCRDFVALYLACGIDPAHSVVFAQSHVPEHCELAWLLQCHTSTGELSRMTQFKDRSRRRDITVNAGLFGYPVLMAADILLYQTSVVPVGEDQKQHLELTRDLAVRFNEAYGPLFTIPKPLIPEVGARIMGLQDPARKMSKSDTTDANVIALLDSPDAIARKIRRSVTDSGSEIVAGPDKPGITNLLNILSATTGVAVADLESQYASRGCGQFKSDVAEAVIALVGPIQERYESTRADASLLDDVLADGAQRASSRASQTLTAVQGALGLIPRRA